MPNRLLFVDDESHVLDGLQNLLRKHRREWDMVFALGGEAALAELERRPFDVVVSDMRMPGIDGAELLRRVQKLYPSVARIILSGHAEREVMVKALPVAHQFLSKPCQADVLRTVIERTCSLQAMLHDEPIRRIVGGIDTLPSAPSCYIELTKALTTTGGGLLAVADIVECDPAMSAKILQLVNSGYFGLGQRITSVRRAVVYLGIEMIQSLALASHVFTVQVPVVPGFSVEELQEHSLLTARLARRIVTDPMRAEEAFAAAIVHDIGRLLLGLAAPEQLAEIIRVAAESKRPRHVVERELLGVTHGEIGAYLLGVWGLPLSIVEAVAYHHAPRTTTIGDTEILAALHIADALVQAPGAAAQGRGEADMLDMAFLEAAGLTARLPRWRELVAWEGNAVALTADPSRH
jgi:HD-like signal output (HDOD) protein